MDCSEVTGALGVLVRPEAEVVAQLDQIGDVTGFGVGDGGCRGQYQLDDAKGDSLLSLERWVLNAVGFNLTCEASIQYGVGLGFWRLSRVREAIQEVGRRNIPPRLRNGLFTKLVQASPVVVGMLDPVFLYL